MIFFPQEKPSQSWARWAPRMPGRVDVLAGLGALPPCGEGRQGSCAAKPMRPWDFGG